MLNMRLNRAVSNTYGCVKILFLLNSQITSHYIPIPEFAILKVNFYSIPHSNKNHKIFKQIEKISILYVQLNEF